MWKFPLVSSKQNLFLVHLTLCLLKKKLVSSKHIFCTLVCSSKCAQADECVAYYYYLNGTCSWFKKVSVMKKAYIYYLHLQQFYVNVYLPGKILRSPDHEIEISLLDIKWSWWLCSFQCDWQADMERVVWCRIISLKNRWRLSCSEYWPRDCK